MRRLLTLLAVAGACAMSALVASLETMVAIDVARNGEPMVICPKPVTLIIHRTHYVDRDTFAHVAHRDRTRQP